MKRIFKLCCFIIFMFFVSSNLVNASSNYTISLSASSVSKGKSVTLYIKGNNVTGGFSVTSSDTTIASLATSSVWVENNTQTVTINTSKVGSVTIKVSPTVISDDNANDLSLAAKTLTLTVNSGSTSGNNSSSNSSLSSDATLKSLSIEGLEISPEFKSDVLEYKVDAEAGTEKIKINASVNDSKASVSGIGEVSVSDGANKLEIVVTAEDKSTKTYVINVNVLEYDPITVKVGDKEYTVIRKESDLPDVDLFEKSTIEIGEEKVNCYYNEKLNIYLIGLKNEDGDVALYVYDSEKDSYVKYEWITVGNVTLYLVNNNSELENFSKYKADISNTSVNIYKIKKSDKLGLIYGINVLTGNKGYYIYDSEEETLARYYDEEVNLYKDKVLDYKNYMMIIVGCVSAVIIIIVIMSLLNTRKKRKKIKK